MKRYRWDCIYDRIKDKNNLIGAEIGVHKGENSGHLLEMHSGLFLFMVDLWSNRTYHEKAVDAVGPEYRKLYENNSVENLMAARIAVKKHINRVSIIREDSIVASQIFNDGYFDFVFIDAAHDYQSVKDDISSWLPKIKKGGFICGHDYDNPDFKGVNRAVEELFYNRGIQVDYDFTWFVEL